MVRNGLGGEPVGVLLDGVKRFDIAVRLDDATRESVEDLRKIPLRTETGALVPLSEVADVSVAEGYSFVRREQLQRYAVIQMRSEEHTSELQSLMRISYAVFCLKKKRKSKQMIYKQTNYAHNRYKI